MRWVIAVFAGLATGIIFHQSVRRGLVGPYTALGVELLVSLLLLGLALAAIFVKNRRRPLLQGLLFLGSALLSLLTVISRVGW